MTCLATRIGPGQSDTAEAVQRLPVAPAPAGGARLADSGDMGDEDPRVSARAAALRLSHSRPGASATPPPGPRT